MNPIALKGFLILLGVNVVLSGSTTIVSRVASNHTATDFILCWAGESNYPDCEDLLISGLDIKKCEGQPESFCLSTNENLQARIRHNSEYCQECTQQLQNYEGDNTLSSVCHLAKLSQDSCLKINSVLKLLDKSRDRDIGLASVPECSSLRLISCPKNTASRQRRGLRSGSRAFGTIDNDGSEDGSNIVMYIVVGVAVFIFLFLVYWIFFRD